MISFRAMNEIRGAYWLILSRAVLELVWHCFAFKNVKNVKKQSQERQQSQERRYHSGRFFTIYLQTVL